MSATVPAERQRPYIERGCKSCGVTEWHIENGLVIVAPSGIAHIGNVYGETHCGKDATGAQWWWPC